MRFYQSILGRAGARMYLIKTKFQIFEREHIIEVYVCLFVCYAKNILSTLSYKALNFK